jgi:Tfp pilus assembly protein PilV
MSTSLTAVQQIEFDALVKAEYQSLGFLLRDTVRTRRDVIGASVSFRKVNQIQAVATGYLQRVTIQDPGYSPINCNIQKYTAPTAVDTVQELTVNFDAKMENAMLVANALGRRSDQIVINALVGNAGQTIANGGTNMNYVKYTEILQFFDNNAVPLPERFVAMSASNFQSLLQADQFVSTFYTQNRVLDKGFIREYLGINLIIIPAMQEGGLPFTNPPTNTIREVFAWHKQAIGMGIGHDFRTEINYLPLETSWLVNGIFSAGACVIDNLGLIEVDCDEAA